LCHAATCLGSLLTICDWLRQLAHAKRTYLTCCTYWILIGDPSEVELGSSQHPTMINSSTYVADHTYDCQKPKGDVCMRSSPTQNKQVSEEV